MSSHYKIKFNIVHEKIEFKGDFRGIFLPKEVLFDTELNATEKLILMSIHYLQGDSGCFASNTYFANFFGLSTKYISQVVSKLASLGYVEVSLTDKRSKRVIVSKLDSVIAGVLERSSVKVVDISGGGGRNNSRGVVEISTTYNNNIYNNIYNKHGENKKLVKEELLSLHKLYESLYQNLVLNGQDTKPKINLPHFFKSMQGLAAQFTYPQILALIICHFEWRGLDGKDEFTFTRLKNAGFPFSWIPNSAQVYSTFLESQVGDVWKDDARLLQQVNDWRAELIKS